VGLFPPFLIVVLLLAFPAAAVATVPAGSASGDVLAADGPAVEAPAEAADEEEQPWTARYLAPAVLLLAVVAIGGSVLYYAVRIRGKYTVAR
jgi:hypothetical protein